MKYIILGILIGLLVGLLGIPIHNYEYKKCQHIVADTNQYYEAQSDCYLVLERPGWNMFWNFIIVAVPGVVWFGIGGLVAEAVWGGL